MTGEIKTTRKLGEDGEWILTEHYFLDGDEVSEADYRKAFPLNRGIGGFATSVRDAKPWVSDALGVNPKQIEAVKERNRKHGLNIAYTPDGRPICTDSGQRKKLMKLHGVRQVNSYYGA